MVTLSHQRVAVAGLPRLESPLVVMMSASAEIALAQRFSLSDTLCKILVVPGWLLGWLFTSISVVHGLGLRIWDLVTCCPLSIVIVKSRWDSF
jgi:hypothetical protein